MPETPGVDRSVALKARLDAATAALDPAFAVVDLAAFDANAAALEKAAAGYADPGGQQVRTLP